MLKIKNLYKEFKINQYDKKIIFNNFNFHVREGEFITIIGNNSAGKSTLMNLITGSLFPDSGEIFIDNNNVTKVPEYKKAKYIARVFQDPLKGTAPNLTIEENLLLAKLRNSKKDLKFGINKKNYDFFKEKLSEFNLRLQDHLKTKVGLLSGGQRQALTLLMATLQKPKILLLDEHTSALDPKISNLVLKQTESIVKNNHLTTLMITHNMDDAIKFGNRLIMLSNGKIILDISGEEKTKFNIEKLINKFLKSEEN